MHHLVFLVIYLQLNAIATADRPNVLFLFADDWGRQASIYAELENEPDISDVVCTPNFDRIAKEGVLFRHAFVNAPSCTPCRSSLLSGQYFWRTGRGAILRGAVWDSSIPSWPLLLRESGYHIGQSWKVWGPGTPVDAPFGGHEYSYEEAGGRINQFSQNVTKLISAGRSVDEAKQEILEEVRENFRKFLTDNTRNQPFCYWFGPTNVHRKWERGSGKTLWGIEPQSLKGKLPPFLPDVPEVREDVADYLGEVQAFDAAMGELIEELRQTDAFENTLIIATGDHGPPGFPHGKCNLYDFGTRVSLAIAGPGVHGGRVVDDFVCLPDLAPTILEAGEIPIPDLMTGRSLWPILASDRNGQVDQTRDAVVMGRERHVENAREGFLPYPQRAIRTTDYLFIINFHPERYPLGDPYGLKGSNPPPEEAIRENTRVTLADEDAGPTKAWIVSRRDDPKWKNVFDYAYGKRPRVELFDLKKDPAQMHNVAADPHYTTAIDDLRERLLATLQQTGDPRLINDGKYYEMPPLAGPLPEEATESKAR